MPLFFAENGESASTIICALEIPDNDWFKRALVQALTLMCDQNNWGERGTASSDFARDKSCEMNETMEFDVIIPTLPIGSVQMWPVAAIPNKWLVCNGQSVLRANYPDLFAVIGTVFGAVDGSHFTLPDYRDYSPMGAGSTVAIGAVAGSVLHPISPGEMPIHNHGVTDPGHTHGINTQTGGTAGANNVIVAGVANVNTVPVVKSTNNNTTGITTQNAGGSSPMSVLHPVRGLHMIIYAGV